MVCRRAPAQHEDVSYEYAGHPEAFPTDSEISLDQVRSAFKEFLRSERHSSIEWQAWPRGTA
ncbi:Imm1 family immunity protein [Kribbella catacumbae]|uniref:Imm1 family immunity protein n=1 Tax=Kribbella catacumbae TaxID=460086 RepID=UPI0003688568